jgi:GNAT superfamily N-acetyltransferase
MTAAERPAAAGFAIADAQAGEMDEVRALFLEYQRWLGVSLCFQGFDEELKTLPGKYARPHGCLLLARAAPQPPPGPEAIAGVVGMRPLADGACEMKRLFVRAPWRGQGLGRRLAEAAIGEARAAGYRRMRLDTLPSMGEARQLYRSLGFFEIDAYYRNPLAGVLYLELPLAGGG